MAGRDFTVYLHDDGPDGLWAHVAELPGCFAAGDTMAELQSAVAEAIVLYLDGDDYAQLTLDGPDESWDELAASDKPVRMSVH